MKPTILVAKLCTCFAQIPFSQEVFVHLNLKLPLAKSLLHGGSEWAL
jgi:hypothetical protein